MHRRDSVDRIVAAEELQRRKKREKKTLKTAKKKSSITILLAILLRLWLSVLLAVLCKQNHDFLNEKRKKEKEKDEEISYAAEDTVERDILAEDILAEDILVLRKGNNEKKEQGMWKREQTNLTRILLRLHCERKKPPIKSYKQ